jgi:hypothetical protein
MYNYQLIFEATEVQQAIVQDLKNEWLTIKDINIISPDDLLGFVEVLITRLNLKTKNDLDTVLNPNAGFMDEEAAKIIQNIIATIYQRMGTEEAEKRIIDFFPKKPE